MKHPSGSAGAWDEIVADADRHHLHVTSPAMESRLHSWLTYPETELNVLHHVFELSGELDTARLRGAWDRVVGRHLSLHASPVAHGGHIWFRDTGDRSRLSAEPLTDPTSHGDPFEGPLVRAALSPRGDRWLLDLAISHLIADGPSVVIILRELSAFYNQPDSDLPSPGSFTGWAANQRGLAFTPESAEADDWWRRRFQDRDTSRRVLGLERAAPQQVDIRASPEVAMQAEAARRRHRVTLYAMALWSTARELCRDGRDDIVFTTSWGHRRSAPDQTVVGCLTSRTLMALDRATIVKGPRAVQNEAWDTFDHTLAPYSHVRAVALGGSTRAVDRDPTLPHFAFGEPTSAGLDLAGVRTVEIDPPTDTGAKSLEFWFSQSGTGLELAVCGPHEAPDLRQLGCDVMNRIAQPDRS